MDTEDYVSLTVEGDDDNDDAEQTVEDTDEEASNMEEDDEDEEQNLEDNDNGEPDMEDHDDEALNKEDNDDAVLTMGVTDDDKSFFQLPEDIQKQHSISKTTYPLLEIFPPKHTWPFKPMAWHGDFEGKLGIVDYTAAFINVHEERGIVVARGTVKLSWDKEVKEKFKDDKEKQELLLLQANCALINDCWAHDEFEFQKNDYSLIDDPNGVRDPTALRVLRWPQTVNGQRSTIMLLDDNEAQINMSNRTQMNADGIVILPFLGLQALKNVSYLDVAARVRRGDRKPLDESLMKAVWRGVIFNMFHFEDKELMSKKVAEEAWASVQQHGTDVGGPVSRKRKFEEL